MSHKIKILYTIPNFNTAGSGIPLLKIANNLDKQYFEPQIACLHDRGDLFQEVIKSDIKVHIIDLYKNARPIINMLSQCYQLSKIFKKINPHIIHSYHYASDYSEPIAAKMARIKWIYTKKNMSWHGPSYRGWKLRSWLANGIICQNSDMLKEFFPKIRKAKLFPIGVDVDEYRKHPENKDIRKYWSIPDNSRIIISVANLVPVKGIEVLIKAFEEVVPNHPNWKLIIIGDDSTKYGIELKKGIPQENNSKRNIIFTGRQKNVRQFLDIAEIYVQPTLKEGRMEGAPIAVQEAMANGKLIIGSNIPGIRDQLHLFPNHLFHAGDICDLKNKLNKYMSNSIQQNKLIGVEFYYFVDKHYNLKNELIKLQSFYKEIIK